MPPSSLTLILALVVCGFATCASAAGNAPASKYQPGTISKAMQQFVDGNQFGGAIMLVADKDNVLVTECVGYSDLKKKTPIKPDAIFWIASMTKAMTSTCIMMLVDEGKISIDDPVEKYLPEFNGQMVLAESDDNHRLLKKPLAPVTIKQLLNHTSGVVGGYPFTGILDTPSLGERVMAAALTPLGFEPNTRFSYGNGGYETAGRIIEVVSGMSYWKFIQDRLIIPLGMKDTNFVLTKSQLARLAKTYTPNDDFTVMTESTIPLTYPLTTKARSANPAGGLFSTANDVARYCQMLLNGGELDGKRYISRESLGIMTTTLTGHLLNDGKSENGYGLGWTTSQYYKPSAPLSVKAYSHSGAYRTDMCVDDEHGLVMVFMTQRGNLGDSSAFTNPFHKLAVENFAK